MIRVRRLLLASTITFVIIATPTQVKADLSGGEFESILSDVLYDQLTQFGADAFQVLAKLLLAPFPGLGEWLPGTLPGVIIGEHPMAMPVTLEETLVYMGDRVLARGRQSEAMDALGADTVTDTAATATEIAALSVLAAAPPISTASQVQLGNQVAIAAVDAANRTNQLLAAQVALESDRALREELAKVEGMAAIIAANPGGVWTGRKTWTPETIQLDF